jgi:Lrp/AsnC family transcriptional regulator, leucine-responsive regulatory protein
MRHRRSCQSPEPYGEFLACFAMDAIDRDILRHLQEDGRMSNLDLARAIKLSPTPTLRRVRELERRGAIRGYRAIVDPEAVQRSFQVLVWIDLVQGTREVIEAFERALLDIPEVVEAQRLFGEPDYLVRVAVRDSDEYERLYTTRLAAMPGVLKARSQIAMKTIKHGLTLPIT